MERTLDLRGARRLSMGLALLTWLTAAAALAETSVTRAPSKIIGENTMVAIKADGSNIDPKLRPYLDAFGVISIGSAGACSGTHLGNGYVLTAGHCFFGETFVGTRVLRNQTCENMKVFWGYRGSPVTGNPKPLVSLQSQCTKVVYAEETAEHDFAIFQVDLAPKVAIAISPENRRTKVGTKLTMVGYPQGRPLEWSQFCALKSAANIGLRTTKGPSTFAHTCDTEPGNSGSSVLAIRANGQPMVVGVHDGAAPLGIEYNFGTYLFDIRNVLKSEGFDLVQALL